MLIWAAYEAHSGCWIKRVRPMNVGGRCEAHEKKGRKEAGWDHWGRWRVEEEGATAWVLEPT